MQDSDTKLSKFYGKIHEISVFQLNKFKCLMDYGFYFRDLNTAQKLKQQKKLIVEQANNFINKEDNLQEYLKQRWQVCKGLFAIKFLEIHLEIDNKYPFYRINQLNKKEQTLRLQEEQEYIKKLEKCRDKFFIYREQVTDEDIKTEILIIDLVILLFKIRIGIRKQNLQEIMLLFDQYQVFIKEMMSFQHSGWIIIQPILMIFAMCRYQSQDYKGSAILFRKAIKLSTIMIQSEFFLESYLPTAEKRMKLQLIIYYCEVKLSKAIFQMTKCLKESILLEQLILKIDGDPYLNAQQKQTIFEKFQRQLEKQKAIIIKNGGTSNRHTDSDIGSAREDQSYRRNDSQLNFQKLAQEANQKSGRFKQQTDSSNKKKIAFLISQKNNEKWFKNAMQSNNIQNNTPIQHQQSQNSMFKLQNNNKSQNSISQQGTLDNISPMYTPLQTPLQNKSPLAKLAPKPQIKSMLIQSVNQVISRRTSVILQVPFHGQGDGDPLNTTNLLKRRTQARSSIFNMNAATLRQQIMNNEPQYTNKSTPKREGPYEIDDEDVENLGNNLSELSITLPHDNESFMDRYIDQKKEDQKNEKIHSINFQNNINIQKDLLIERIQLFKKRKGDALFKSGPIVFQNVKEEQQDRQRKEIEQSLGKEVQERFEQLVIPMYKTAYQQQSEVNIQSVQEQPQQIKKIIHHQKSKSLQSPPGQIFSSTQLQMEPQLQQPNQQLNVQQQVPPERISMSNISLEKQISSMTNIKKQRVFSAHLNKNNQEINKNIPNSQIHFNTYNNYVNQQQQQKRQPKMLSLHLPQQQSHSHTKSQYHPFSSSTALITPKSPPNNISNPKFFRSSSIQSPKNNNDPNSSHKASFQKSQNYFTERTPQELRQTPTMKQAGVVINQFNSGSKSQSNREQQHHNSQITSMEYISDHQLGSGIHSQMKNYKNSMSNIHSPEMSSFSTDRTNDSRVNYRVQQAKNSKKLSNIIGLDQANQIMNARPKWDISQSSSTKNEEQAVKGKKIKSTVNLIDQLIGQSQIMIENQYANPLDADVPFPFIQYALKNVEQERILQNLIKKSQSNSQVLESQKQLVKDIVQKKKGTPRQLHEEQVEKLQQNMRNEILNQQSKIVEEDNTKNDMDKIEESFNLYLRQKSQIISKEIALEIERLKSQDFQQELQIIDKSNNKVSSRSQFFQQKMESSCSPRNLNNKNERNEKQIKNELNTSKSSISSSNHLKQKQSIEGEEKYLEIQDLERSRKISQNKKGLKALLDTEESRDPSKQIEESGNMSDQSEYLDQVDILEDDQISDNHENPNSIVLDSKKKKPISGIIKERDEEGFVSENIIKHIPDSKKKEQNNQSIELIQTPESNEEGSQTEFKFSIHTLNSIRTIAQSKLLMRKQRALSQSEIQNMMSPLPKTVIQIQDEDEQFISIEKPYPPFEFVLCHPHVTELVQVSFEQHKDENSQTKYSLRFVSNSINDKLEIDFNFYGHSHLKRLIDQYTIWPIVLEALKKQLILQGLDELINDKTMNDGQYLIADQPQLKEDIHDQTVEELQEWRNNLMNDNHLKLHPIKKKVQVYSSSENLEFIKEGGVRALKRASTFFLRAKFSLSFFTNFDKGNTKFISELDIKSVCSIKNLLNQYFLTCYEYANNISGNSLRSRIEQDDINFISAQKTIHQIFKKQKTISRLQARMNALPYLSDKVEPGWSIRIVMFKNEHIQKEHITSTEQAEQITSRSSTNRMDKELALTRREKHFLHYWLRNQKFSIQKEKELKFNLSEYLGEKKDDVIFYLTRKLQQKSLIGVLLKRQYITNELFFIDVYLNHNKSKEINLYQTIDKYCKIKELPFVIYLAGRNISNLQRIQPFELPIETLIGFFSEEEIKSSITQLLLTGKMKKSFRRKLLEYIQYNIYIILSYVTERRRKLLSQDEIDSIPTGTSKQLRIVFQNSNFDEMNQVHMDPSLIFQDLPHIFSERVKQQIESSLYEKLFEQLFNDVYEKNFLNKKNVDIDAIFHNLSQQNSNLEKNALKEGEIQMEDNDKNNNALQVLSQNNSYINFNQMGEDALQASNTDESGEMQIANHNFDESEKQQHIYQIPMSRKLISQQSHAISVKCFGKFNSIARTVKGQLKSLEQQRKKIIRNIKLVQDIQNNLMPQQNLLSQNNLSFESSFVSHNNLQGSFYFYENNFNRQGILKIIKMTIIKEYILERLQKWLKRADYQMDWQGYGLFGRFLIYINELGKIVFKINNFLPKMEFTFSKITEKQVNIMVNILTYAINMRCDENKPIQNRRLILRYMLQNLVQKDFKSLNSFRFTPRKPTEYGTQQLILSNNASLQYHLNLQTKEFLQAYSNVKQTFAQNIKNIGRSFILGQAFSLNTKDSAKKYQILLSMNIFPLLSKTITYKIMLSLQDISNLDPSIGTRIITQNMSSACIMNAFKTVLKKSVFINTQIGRLPIIHYSQTTFSSIINTPSTSKRLFKTQVYDGKKLSGIYSRNNQRLRSLQNANFEEASEAAFNNSRIDDEMFQWTNHLNELRVFRNSMIKINFDQKVAEKQSQNFINEDIMRYRFIYSISKIFQNEYILVSVFRDLLLQNWLIRFYFPRNCRYLQCHIDSSDLFQASSKFLKKTVSNQIIWFSHENEYSEIFSSYLDLQIRLNLQGLSNKQKKQKLAEKFTPSPLFLSKKGNLHLKMNELKKYSIIQHNTLSGNRGTFTSQYPKSPFSSNSPSPTLKHQDSSLSNSRTDMQASPQANSNLMMSKFFTEKQAANTAKSVKTKKHKLSIKINTNRTTSQPHYQNQSILQNEPTIDSQYDLSSQNRSSDKQGSFQDYFRKYMQTERQIPLKKRQLSGIFDASRRNYTSERNLYIYKNDSNTSLNQEIIEAKEENLPPYIFPSASSLETGEKKSSTFRRSTNKIQMAEVSENEVEYSQNLLRSKLERVQVNRDNLPQVNIQSAQETSQQLKNQIEVLPQFKEEQTQELLPQKRRLKDIVHKHLKGVKLVNNVKSIVEYIKPKRHDKINRIERLKNMTLMQDHYFSATIKQLHQIKNLRAKKQQQLFYKKQEKNERFYEIKIWENMINYINLRHTCMQIDLGGTGINLKEILVSKYLRVDKQNENFFEISIDLLEVLQKKNMQIQMQNNGGSIQDFEINFKNLLSQFMENQQASLLNIQIKQEEEEILSEQERLKEGSIIQEANKNTAEARDQTIKRIRETANKTFSISTKNIKKASGVDYFFPIEYIQYAATSAYNFTISHMNLNSASYQDIYLNCREITNVFIAEGYFKYQANYIYSNINYADVSNLAQFILYKISNSNFLEMLYDKSEQKRIKKEDLNQLKKGNIPPKYNKKNIRFINPQNIVFMFTKIISPKKRLYLRSSISTHDMIFNLEMFQIQTKNSLKISKTFSKMLKKIPFLKQHFEMGEISYVLKHITEFYEQQMTIAWSLKYAG